MANLRVWCLILLLLARSPELAGSFDFDSDGYIGPLDFALMFVCLTESGPGATGLCPMCQAHFDGELDGDVDLVDAAAFQRARGHLPIPLKDTSGATITLGSSQPYDGRQTCGGCHDVSVISNGFLFQQGRTDTAGNLDMRDDYHGDGRLWIKSSGRYGKWGQSFRYLLAAKENARPSDIDQTAFAWVRDCGACHPGGGPGEYDRDGLAFFDSSTGLSGYEALGKSPGDVELSGDYALIDYGTGDARPAPWNVTGLARPDCLRCHRTQRTVINGQDMNHVWRQSVLAASEHLVDPFGQPIPAFESAATAGQGWFSQPGPTAQSQPACESEGGSFADETWFLGGEGSSVSSVAQPMLAIDYSGGVADGSVMCGEGGTVHLAPHSVTWPPKDQACMACHPFQTITGTIWFDSRDVLYSYFNNLSDDDPRNDISPQNSRVCTVCHVGDLTHNFGRGNSQQIHYRDDLDWHNLRHCRSCHIATFTDGQPNAGKHPDAPEYPGDVVAHMKMESEGNQMWLSCQACHIPSARAPAVLFRDITIPGAVGTTAQYLSADPLNPADPDKSTWYPAFAWKRDADGVERLFPVNYWITIYWGDWNQNGTPGDLSDDVISPIPVWRTAQVIPQPLDVVTDDNSDGQLEINRPEEILPNLELLKQPDAHGIPVATNPVLVKGVRVWHADPQAPEGIAYFDHRTSGINMTFYPYTWGLDHNVQPVEESLGYAPNHGPGCSDCHRPATHDSPGWDRLILVDPYGPDGQPVYETVRQMTGLNPP